MILPRVAPSIVRLSVIGGRGPERVIVHGGAPHENVIESGPAAAFAARICDLRSPALPAPVPANPPELPSVNTVTVKVAAIAMGADKDRAASKNKLPDTDRSRMLFRITYTSHVCCAALTALLLLALHPRPT